MQSTEQKIERAALAGLAAASMDTRERSTDISLAELAALVETAGGQPVATLLQNKPTPDPRTFLGEGKVAEIKELIGSTEATMAIFDNDLSPSQMRVLTEDLGVQVLDRSGLILAAVAAVVVLTAVTAGGQRQHHHQRQQQRHYLFHRFHGKNPSLLLDYVPLDAAQEGKFPAFFKNFFTPCGGGSGGDAWTQCPPCGTGGAS